MKLAIRAFALGLVLVGAVAANSVPKNAQFVSAQAASHPHPQCDPDTDCSF